MELPQLIRLMLVADDSSLAGWLLRVLEKAEPGSIELVGAIASGDQAYALVAKAQPDVILLDIEAGGSAAITRFGADCPAPILALARECDAAARARAVRSGARGVVLKRDTPATIRKAVRKVNDGELWIDRVTTARLLRELSAGVPRTIEPAANGKIANLTSRENDIVRALLGQDGASSRALAERLHMSEHTLRNHFSSIYRKLGIPNRVGLVAYATRHLVASVG